MTTATRPQKRNVQVPSWVKAGVLAHHKPSNVLFWIGSVQRSPNQQICLCDFERGQTGSRYSIEECEPGSIAHFRSVAIVSQCGTPISVVREPADVADKDQRDRVIFFTDDKRVEVRIDPNAFCNPDLMQASRSIAEFFSGAIGRVEEVTDA